MSDAAWRGFSLVYIGLILLDISMVMVDYRFYTTTWSWYFKPPYVLITFLMAAGALTRDDWISTGLFSAWSLLAAWSWWHNDHNKRRRKKLRKRLAEKVAIRGGRLVVVRPAQR